MRINFSLNGLYNKNLNPAVVKSTGSPAMVVNYSSIPSTDTFEKSSNISFKASESTKSMLKDLAAAGGAVALVAVPTVAAIAVTRNEHPEDIFLPDGTYFGNVRDFKVNDEAAKNAGIDFSKDRFTFRDPVNGVFKNPEKGIDINFTQGKYIDPENGIFLDKSTGMSAVYNNGHFDPVAIPNVSFEGYYDPSAPVFIPKHYPQTLPREEFINEYGMPPEEYYNNIRPSSPEIGFTPIDRRSVLEKIQDWFNDKSPDKTDYWGREVVSIKDRAGNIHEVPLSDKLSDIIHDRKMSYEDVQNFITYQAEHPVAGYISEHTPQYMSDYNLAGRPHMDDFIANADSHYNNTSSDLSSHSDSYETNSSDSTDGSSGDGFSLDGTDGSGLDDFSGML